MSSDSTLSSITILSSDMSSFLNVDTDSQRYAEVSSVSGGKLTLELRHGVSLRVVNNSKDEAFKNIAVGTIVYYNIDGTWNGKIKAPPAPAKKVATRTSVGSTERARNF